MDVQGREHGGIFDADDAASDHNHMSGKLLQTRHVVAAEEEFPIELHTVHQRRYGADGNQNIGRRDCPDAVFRGDGYGVGITERGVAMKQSDIVATQLLGDDVHLSPYHLFDPGEELPRRRATLIAIAHVLVEMMDYRI